MKKISKQFGFNLIELLITITLGSFLILGASFAFQEAQKTYVVNDSVARLFENAQYVLDVLEEDIRLSSYWGLHNRRAVVTGDSNDPAMATAVTGITGDCDSEWALDLRTGISGTNGNGLKTPPDAPPTTPPLPAWAETSGCLADGGGTTDFNDKSDTFVVKHADFDVIPTDELEDGQVYVRSHESTATQIFEGPKANEPIISDTAQNYEYVAHAYYVTNNSYTDSDAIPMLRRMALVDNGTAPGVESQEVIAGVEDFQIQFGVDTNLRTDDGYGSIDRYVNPDSPLLAVATTRVLTVRVWVLLRGQDAEPNFTNTSTYNYGTVTDYTPDDNFRRLLVSKTIQVRNMGIN